MKFKLIIFVLIIALTVSGKNENKIFYTDKIGKYQDKSGKMLISLEQMKEDTIFGNHCFVFLNGDRIDCCTDEYSSIRIFSTDSFNYKGCLRSCYDGADYKINMLFMGDSLTLFFNDSIYPFSLAPIVFYKIKDTR